jgi:hypothetical protein
MLSNTSRELYSLGERSQEIEITRSMFHENSSISELVSDGNRKLEEGKRTNRLSRTQKDEETRFHGMLQAMAPAFLVCLLSQILSSHHRFAFVRQAYGRACFDLLRLRVLHGSGRGNHQKCV